MKTAASLPRGATPEAILEAYWPDRVHRFVWRNWSLVGLDRLAGALGSTTISSRLRRCVAAQRS